MKMKTLPIFDEIREEARAEEARTLVLVQGVQKFGKPPSKKQQKALDTIADLGGGMAMRALFPSRFPPPSRSCP